MTTRLASIRVGAGISTRRSGLAAAEDALGSALAPLEGAIPDLAFLFVAPQFGDELESIIESANASLGGGTLVLLARAVQRRGEFALRAALGAARRRLIRQLLTESVLLAAMGGVVGMIVAMAGVRALVALSPPGLPRVGAIRISGTVFAFGLGITTVIGFEFKPPVGQFAFLAHYAGSKDGAFAPSDGTCEELDVVPAPPKS